MLTPQLLKEIKHIELKAGFIANEVLGGEYLSAFKGQGMEFDTLRDYQFGDDVRNIDWNVTARMNYPYIKVMREEREMTLLLLIDVSASQHFGSTVTSKQETAAELAAVLAFLAIRHNDRVGLILFSDRIEQYIPAAKGRSHVWHIIKSVLTPRQFNAGTNIKQALDFLMKVTHKKHMCFLISDFITPKLPKTLANVARRHDLIAVQVKDAREAQLSSSGLLDFIDSESGECVTLDTSNKQTQAALRQAQQQRQQRWQKQWRKNRVDNFVISTASSTARPLMTFLQQRTPRRKR